MLLLTLLLMDTIYLDKHSIFGLGQAEIKTSVCFKYIFRCSSFMFDPHLLTN